MLQVILHNAAQGSSNLSRQLLVVAHNDSTLEYYLLHKTMTDATHDECSQVRKVLKL